ncbi:MAG: DUF72 domain-containing protein [Steroidobacteraceae bacterium]
MASPRIRIGISGWRYAPWRGTFYPKGLPQRAELEFAAKILPVIEINGSFYSLQTPASYAKWYAQTPEHFLFSVKGSRYITHMKRLKDVEQALANFFAQGIFNLREKLGPILWQFPPNFKFDRSRMQGFLDLLPRDSAGAAALARKRDPFMKGRCRLATGDNRPLRYALEIRNESFLTASFVDLLREYNAAAVIAETAGKWPMIEDITADFLYMRLHGDQEIYRSGYSDKSLQLWAGRIERWHRGLEPDDARKVEPARSPPKRRRDVFCFFDNTDVKLRAPFDAQTLARKLRLPVPGGPARARRRD